MLRRPMARFWDWAGDLDPEERQALRQFLMYPSRNRDEYIVWLRARGWESLAATGRPDPDRAWSNRVFRERASKP